ncbi:tyrosine-type recombinase/integrase [Lentzea aerocolonigenes]|uniref:tyrosine-type recombinase/integrase n=1 Tax=Lentzea aerocolonigenes TaxID=68170 RepID=UPI0005EC3B63|nr:tyrosine-type recombinase/integrase [Lentzea aerocolonigenes]
MSERLDRLAASFDRALRADGKSERTRVLYGQSIRFFSEWLVREGREPELDEFTRLAVREWMNELKGTKAPGTVAVRFRGLRRFSRWLVVEEIRDKNVMAGMEAPEVPEKPVPVLVDDELAALLKLCKGKDFRSRRDEAMVRLFFDCGLRVAELCGIQLDHVDLDAEVIQVTGKGDKVRLVYPSAKTFRAVERYIRERAKSKHARTTKALFLSQRGAWSVDGVRDRLGVMAKQAGLDHINPHRFRHTFAHDYLLSGGQERDLKRLAGWTSDVMLEVYGRSTAQQRAAHAARKLGRGNRL